MLENLGNELPDPERPVGGLGVQDKARVEIGIEIWKFYPEAFDSLGLGAEFKCNCKNPHYSLPILHPAT